MHIPDGYLSPATCVALYGASMPFWYQAGKRVKRSLTGRAAPLLAVFAAFSFTIQMFNIPIPGGTSAHAVGGTLVAIVLGPSAAVVGVSVALVIQALFFGDGGITAIGANAFNIAIALPLTGFLVYRLLANGASSDRRRIAAAVVAGYVGINVAGMLGALELGIQPALWSVDGRALYNPYGFSATIPAMALAHLTLAGFAEAALTGFAMAYLLRSHRSLVLPPPSEAAVRKAVPRARPLALFSIVAALVLLVPVGLLASGSGAFEWSSAELSGLVGYVPAGLAGLNGLWQASPFPSYQLPGGGGGDFFSRATGYFLSGVVGVGLILVVTFSARLALGRRAGHESSGTRGG